METLDFVVIGAGWAGLAAAKTRHQLHPEESLAVLDSSATVGGTWAQHRLYPGLKSNNMLGTYEYPDFPMHSKTYGVKPGQHIPGSVIHQYLTQYAQHFDVFDKIRFEHSVMSAEHQEDDSGGWVLTVRNDAATATAKTVQLFAKRLVVATGLTSQAFLPHFQGQEDFDAPLFHGKDFLKHADTLRTAKSVTVFGGTKTAWDLVYQYATKGIQVNWVIRESGHGPVWMAPPYVTPLKKWLEKLVHTRMLTWFSPCSWGNADGWVGTRNFYHGSTLGRAIVNKFWDILGGDVLALNQYDAHPETAKLKPWSEAFYVASSLSILNYDTDFFDLVRDGIVKVHIADINGLSDKNKVHLSSGAVLETDALCCSTGWKHVPPIKFLPEGIDNDLGIPHTPTHASFPSTELVARVDRDILARFPRLRDQPVQNNKYEPLLQNRGLSSSDDITPSTSLTPWTLYHFIAPPSERFLARRDIAFAGILMNITVSTVAHAQSLWINAYFDRAIPSLNHAAAWSSEQVDRFKYEAVLHNRFCKWRYPAGHGSKFPDFVFDAMPYLDMLLGDMGLDVYRKDGLVAEATSPYGPEDYRTLVDEWKAKKQIVKT